MAVDYVDRNSDDLEPFDEVIKQADDRPPPRIKSIKKRMSIAPPIELVDEDGEMSMELAESEHHQNSTVVLDSCLVPYRQSGQSAGLLYECKPPVCSR